MRFNTYDCAMTTLTRQIPTTPEHVWELWTTAAGIARWWAPDGFRTDVTRIDVREGGELDYTMTAVDPAQVAFMEEHGLPLTTTSHKRFTEVAAPARIDYLSLIDFVPGVEPYDHLTTVELTATDGGTLVTMTMDDLHDAEWTGRLVAGRENELDNLLALASGA